MAYPIVPTNPTSVTQETSQNLALGQCTAQAPAQNASEVVALVGDGTLKKVQIVGDTSGPALTVSGGQQATFGAELLTNPSFASNADSWTLNEGARWSGGDVLFTNGVLKTVAVKTRVSQPAAQVTGGSAYTQGDTLTVTDVIVSPLNMSAQNLPSPYYVNVTSTAGGPYAGWKLFDDDYAAWWASAAQPSSGTPQNVAIDLGAATLVTGIRLQSIDNTQYWAGDFKLQGSNVANATQTYIADDSKWTDIATASGLANPGLYLWGQLDNAAQTATYRHFRVRATSTTSGVWQLAGMELICSNIPSKGTFTATTVSAGHVTALAIATKGYGHPTGVAHVTGGTGVYLYVTISAVDNATMSQAVTVENAAQYKTLLTPGSCDVGYFIASGPGFTTQGWSAENAQGGVTSGVSATLTFTWYGTTNIGIGRISAASIKKITQFYGTVETITGSDAVTMVSLLNQPGAYDNFLLRGGTKCAVATHSIAILDNALDRYLGGTHDLGSHCIGIGNHSLDYITSEDGCTAVGGYSASGSIGREITAVGYLAGSTTNGTQQAYSTFLGCAAGWLGALTSSFVGGIHCGYQGVGNNNLWICNNTAAVAFPTIDDCLILSPKSGPNYFLYGIHDNAGTTGYLKLRGNFSGDADNTYTSGTSAFKWASVYTNKINLGTLPANGITVGAAAPVGGAHLVGELVINSAPTSIGIWGWACTTAGTPGKWAAIILGAEA